MTICKYCKGTGLMPITIALNKPLAVWDNGKVKWDTMRVEDTNDRTCVCRGGKSGAEVRVVEQAKRSE